MYKNRYTVSFPVGGSSGATLLDTSSTANLVLFELPIGINVTYLYAAVSTTFSSSANAVVSVFYRPTPGSTAAQVAIGTLSFPTGAAAPNFFYKPTADNTCYAGGELAFTVSTAASTAGKVYVSFEGGEAPESPVNVPNATLSV
jgi:hypothetical protein